MLICVLIISFSFLSGFIPRNYNFSSIINTSNNDFTIITNSFNQKVLVVNNKADLEDYKTLKKDLFNYKIFKLDAIILSFYSSSSQDFVVSVCNDYSVNSFYVSSLEDLEEKGLIEIESVPEYSKHNAHMFYIKTKDLDERTKLLKYLKQNDVQAVFHYIPLHNAPAGKKFGTFCGEDKYTTVESDKLVRLPMYYGLTKFDQDIVINKVKDFYKNNT